MNLLARHVEFFLVNLIKVMYFVVRLVDTPEKLFIMYVKIVMKHSLRDATIQKDGYKYCGIKCSSESQKGRTKISAICEGCGNPFKYNVMGDRFRKYCKISCKPLNTLDWVCQYCGDDFTRPIAGDKTYKFCGESCSNLGKDSSIATRSQYKDTDIWFDSSWEEVFALRCDDLGIKWIRDRKLNLQWFDSDGKARIYTPDFWLPDYQVYIEIKSEYTIRRGSPDNVKLKQELLEYTKRNFKDVIFIWSLEECEILYKRKITPHNRIKERITHAYERDDRKRNL